MNTATGVRDSAVSGENPARDSPLEMITTAMCEQEDTIVCYSYHPMWNMRPRNVVRTPIPATLATLLLQYLSTLALPSALCLDTMTPVAPQDDLLRQADTHVPSTEALRTLVEQLLQDHTVLDAIQRVLDTARMSNAGEPSGAAGGTDASTVPHTEAGGKPLDTYAQVLTPVLAKLLAAHLDAVVGQAAPPEHTAPSRALPLPLETYLYVLSAAHYQAVREVLAYGTFAQGRREPVAHGAADEGPRPRPRPAPARGYGSATVPAA